MLRRFGCLFPAAAMLLQAGCYSSARHVASVHPAAVKPASGIGCRYRVDRLLLSESSYLAGVKRLAPARASFQRELSAKSKSAFYNGIVEDVGYEIACSLASRDDIWKVVSDLEKRHEEDAGKIRKCVMDSLCRNYPSVFSEDSSAIPLTVLVHWTTSYGKRPNYASIFGYWLWPEAADQETVYRIRVLEGARQVSAEKLWRDFNASTERYPQPVENSSAVRTSEVWETGLLPFGFIPVPGDSDWPKTFCFMRTGKDSLVGDPAQTLRSADCVRDLVFEPKTDGDVIAAAIMRSINRKRREQQIDKLLSKQGGR
ncbi:MAG: hypothetical protein ILO34_07295 [Kiritimatiellae bacterium]|nr:hypothetical protein [Kiritimatiellia bacterium]